MTQTEQIEICDPEFIDGSYYGCGGCADCIQQESDDIERAVEMGEITEEEAIESHRQNGSWTHEDDEAWESDQ